MCQPLRNPLSPQALAQASWSWSAAALGEPPPKGGGRPTAAPDGRLSVRADPVTFAGTRQSAALAAAQGAAFGVPSNSGLLYGPARPFAVLFWGVLVYRRRRRRNFATDRHEFLLGYDEMDTIGRRHGWAVFGFLRQTRDTSSTGIPAASNDESTSTTQRRHVCATMDSTAWTTRPRPRKTRRARLERKLIKLKR